MRKPVFGFPTKSDTNQALQSHRMAKGSKFRIYELEGLYYLCSKSKGADQLRGYTKIRFSHDAAHIRYCHSVTIK